MSRNNPKILFVANVDKEHILKFHTPTIKMLRDKNWIVDVACAGNEEIPFCNNRYVLHYERSPFTPKLFKGISELCKIINENDYDMVYCHTPVGGLAARIASIKARKKGTKVIYFAHGYHFFKGAPLLNWLIYYTIEKIMSLFTDSIITINDEDFEITKKNFRNCTPYKINGIGIDTEKFKADTDNSNIRAQYRESMNIPEDATVLVYLAELIKNKNQFFLLRVLKKLIDDGNNNIYLVLAGIDHADGKVENYAEELNIRDNIRYLGWRNDIRNLYCMSDICTASSIREGFGLNIAEAMLCSIPVVAAENRGHNTIIKDGYNGYLVPQGDENTFAEKILSLINNEKEREMIVTNASHGAEKYTTGVVLNDLYDILSSHIQEEK